MDKLIEKYKVYLGFFLVFAIILGGIILLWQKDVLDDFSNKLKTNEEIELENCKKENQDSKKKISQLEENIKNLESEKQVLGESASSADKQASNSGSSGEKININTADASELDKLPGVGPSRAQSIIDYRQQTGGFNSIDEIQNIKGIGPATFMKMKDIISVE